jgi:hypothetical protein
MVKEDASCATLDKLEWLKEKIITASAKLAQVIMLND